MKLTLHQSLTAALVAAVSFLNPQLSAAAEPEVHNFANYNIRYTNNADDTEANGRHWSQRGEYVLRLIRDYDFDVVGLEEVTGRSGKYSINPYTGTSQLEDVRAGLPEYATLEYERSGDNNAKDYSYNVIAYKKDKYELVETSCFWLSPTPNTPSAGWDPDPSYSGIWRTCAWARLKVKSTGQEFIFAATHVNYGPSLDGLNSGILISKRLSEIAGSLPVILVGDFNMRRDDHEDAYRNYAASFYDAVDIAQTNVCLPEENGSTTYTAQDWTPLAPGRTINGSEFDFGFCRRMDVLSRHIITENYGRNVNPSDHFPLLMRCVLQDRTEPTTTVYVDPKAASAGDGTISAPFTTLEQAIEASEICGNVYLTAGEYDCGLTLPYSVNLYGGYNSDFSSVIGRSTLNAAECGIKVEHHCSLSVQDINIEGGDAAMGISFNGSQLSLQNVGISNCTGDVGGMKARGYSIGLQNVKFDGNKATNGGGAHLEATTLVDIQDCEFTHNQATYNGAALYLNTCGEFKLYGSTFTDNTGVRSGALYLAKSTAATTYSILNCTFANNTLAGASALPTVIKTYAGAAVAALMGNDASRLNMAHCTIVGNTATLAKDSKTNFLASAVNISGGTFCLMNNIIAGNYSESEVDDLGVDGSTLEKEMGNVYSHANSASITFGSNVTYAPDMATACAYLAEMLDGTATDGRFTARVVNNGGITPTVAVLSHNFGDKALNTISAYSRLISTSFGTDMPGLKNNYLDLDQRGVVRESLTMPGAVEYIGHTGIDNPQADAKPFTFAVVDGCININIGTGVRNICVYDMSGRMVASHHCPDGAGSIRIECRPGIYVLVADGYAIKAKV